MSAMRFSKHLFSAVKSVARALASYQSEKYVCTEDAHSRAWPALAEQASQLLKPPHVPALKGVGSRDLEQSTNRPKAQRRK